MTDFGRELNAFEKDPLASVSNLGAELWKEMKQHPVETIVGGALLAGGALALGKRLLGGTAADFADEALAKSAAGETLGPASAAVSTDARTALFADARETRMATPPTAHPATPQAIGISTGDPSIARPGEW